MQDGIILWCNRIIRWGFYALFAIIPLLLTPWNYELFEYNKMMAVYIVTAFIVTSWVVKSLTQKEFKLARTPLDIPIALFVASQLVSALFSIDPHVSWFGYYSRFNGGVWSVISYVLLYYSFLSNSEAFSDLPDESDVSRITYHVSGKKQKNQTVIRNTNPLIRLLSISLVTATVVALYGVLERLGIDKHLWVQDVQNRVFSTLGQPNWLAAYLVALIPLTMAFFLTGLQSHVSTKSTGIRGFVFGIWGIATLLFFVVLLFTRSRSGLLGFAVADVVFWGIFLTKLSFFRKIVLQSLALKWVTALHVVFALIIFINGTGVEKLDTWISFRGLQQRIQHQPFDKTQDKGSALNSEPTTSTPTITGPALEVGGTESGTIRSYVWQGAINAWNSSWKTRLIGTGTETFAFAFYEFRPVGHNNTSEWDFLYNKAHNEYLNYLATTGALGLGSYILFIGTFIIWFIKAYHVSRITYQGNKNLTLDTLTHDTVTLALFAGWLSILVTNFFGFSVVTQQLFLFLFPALIVSQYTKYLPRRPASPNRGEQAGEIRNTIRLPSWAIWIPVIGGLYVVIKIGSFWYADTLYAKGYRFIRGGLYGQAIPALTSAIRINPAEPMYHDEIASGYATLAVAAAEGKNATQAAQLATLSIDESGKALATSPRNVNFYKTRTKVYYTLAALDPTFNAKAVEALEMAIPLSPNDPKIYYNLAILVGRDGESDKAIEYLLKAKDLKPNYRDAYYALWVFYTEENKLADAGAILQEYVDAVDPNDTQFKEILNK